MLVAALSAFTVYGNTVHSERFTLRAPVWLHAWLAWLGADGGRERARAAGRRFDGPVRRTAACVRVWFRPGPGSAGRAGREGQGGAGRRARPRGGPAEPTARARAVRPARWSRPLGDVRPVRLARPARPCGPLQWSGGSNYGPFGWCGAVGD